MTPAQFQQALELLEAGADVALPLMGDAEFVPVANSAVALIQKVATYIQTRQGDAAVAAAMTAGRLAADVAEQLKFPKT